MSLSARWAVAAFAAAAALSTLHAGDPGPTQPPGAASPPYSGGQLNAPFPDNYYGADHGGSSLTLSYPFVSAFGRTDHSRGVVTYSCAPFTPRRSEGVYGMDVWLEAANPDGSWSPVALAMDGGGPPYQPVNTPNPGPSPSYRFQWTFDAVRLPPETAMRVFIYVYLYNQGGGSQGNFYVASSMGGVFTGPANDPPVLQWLPTFSNVNPVSVPAGSAYQIAAAAQDDNGNLTSVTIWKDGVTFATVGGDGGLAGDGNFAQPVGATIAVPGTATYTAQATDAAGAMSELLTWQVTVLDRLAQPPIDAPDGAVVVGQTFIPAYSGGAGSGVWQFAVAGQTNWDGAVSPNTGTENFDGTWTPGWTPTTAGTYLFWISHGGDAAYQPAAFSGPHTLTVSDPPPPPAPAPVPAPPAPTPTVTPPSPSPPDPSPSPAPAPVSPPPPPDPVPPPDPAPTSDPASVTPTPPAQPTATTSPVPSIARVRFNAQGSEASVHHAGSRGAAPLWTDPAALSLHPWPAFAPLNPAAATVGPITLPPVPAAPDGS